MRPTVRAVPLRLAGGQRRLESRQRSARAHLDHTILPIAYAGDLKDEFESPGPLFASADPGSELTISVDGKVINTIKVDAEDLYSLVNSEYGSHTLSFDVNGSGFKLYTFTFG